MTLAAQSKVDAPLLAVRDLSFTHSGQPQPTLSGVNLTLNPGELVVLAGATGSGKSTLLNCLTGIAPEHTGGQLRGQVCYQGEDITHWPIRDRAQMMGMLLQNVETQIFTDQVWEELVFGLENWDLPPDRIHTLAAGVLQEFALVEQRQWSIRQLSAGQKQRLLLACLLTRNPPILLLDEPLAFLDKDGVGVLLALIQQRVAQGQGVLMIEHRLEVLHPICDRAYRISDGVLTPWPVNQLLPSAAAGERLAAGPVGGFTPEGPGPASSAYPPASPSAPALMLQTQRLSWGGYAPFPDLRVYATETVLLKGDNGCGKTTLLKLISGLLKPTSGHIQLLGQEVTHKGVVQRAQTIGFVLQNPNHQLFADSVAAAVQQPGVSSEQAATLLAQLNLSPCADSHPHALSQGQKRRLALGAVLARQPQVCLLDEIMVGQDPQSLALMVQTLQHFTAAGGVLIFTSHDPSVAEQLAARVVAVD